jgi:hypothetical protein
MPSRWAEIRAKKTATQAGKARYDATYRSILAHRIAVSPSAVPRILTPKIK